MFMPNDGLGGGGDGTLGRWFISGMDSCCICGRDGMDGGLCAIFGGGIGTDPDAFRVKLDPSLTIVGLA